jgi:hypothetical protein
MRDWSHPHSPLPPPPRYYMSSQQS